MAELTVETIRRAQVGDHEALTQLVLSHQAYIYSIAMGIFRDPDEAADMTQEVFLHLFRVLPTFREETRFTTWLYRVVVNMCYDELRRRKRQPLPIENAEDALPFIPDPDEWSDPEQAVTHSETQKWVRQALWHLEEPYRLTLILYYFRGLKYREISEITGFPLNTVKSHIRRGRARLAELLTDPADSGNKPSSLQAPSEDLAGRPPAPELPLALAAGQMR